MNTAIDIKKREVEGVLVFEFSGELDETNADRTFTAIVSEIGDFTDKKLVFNLAGLKYLNSKSIGYIADVFGNIEENNGRMALSNLGEDVRDTLELVGITSIVPVFDSEDEAVVSMR
ncbi:MAG TPA: STAS domain-containing protein [bacterium]|nr:STAS domain-containing protein [bacterium]